MWARDDNVDSVDAGRSGNHEHPSWHRVASTLYCVEGAPIAPTSKAGWFFGYASRSP